MRVGRTRYVSHEERKCRDSVCYIITAILWLIFGLAVYNYEWEWKEKNIAFGEARNVVYETTDKKILAQDVGQIIHFRTSNIRPNSPVIDHDFNLQAPNGVVQLRRKVEYCQWQEFQTHNKDDDGNEYVTYYYVKGWHSHPIVSLVFNQPAAHHNPLRDPFPARRWSTPASLGAYSAPSQLMESLTNFQPITEYPMNVLQDFSHSTAATGFSYIGNGYFYSPFVASDAHRLFKVFGEFLEGSILDFQIGDLFSVCTAGDIRVSYDIIKPSTVSVVAQLNDINGHLGKVTSSRGYEWFLIEEGEHSAHELLDRNLWWSRVYVIACRFGFALFTWLSLVIFGIPASVGVILTLTIFCSIFSAFWAMLYGVSVQVVLVAGVALGSFWFAQRAHMDVEPQKRD